MNQYQSTSSSNDLKKNNNTEKEKLLKIEKNQAVGTMNVDNSDRRVLRSNESQKAVQHLLGTERKKENQPRIHYQMVLSFKNKSCNKNYSRNINVEIIHHNQTFITRNINRSFQYVRKCYKMKI